MNNDVYCNTWQIAYPDRKPWNKLSKDVQDEWIRVFEIYEACAHPNQKIDVPEAK